MAYCRFGANSEAYVLATVNELWCVSCRISRDYERESKWYRTWTTTSRQAMIEHLQLHRDWAWKVPFSATRRLRREIKKYGDSYV